MALEHQRKLGRPRRAASRAGGRAPARADRLLAETDLLAITAEVFDDAARLAPPGLRSLDALHIAAAQLLGSDLDGMVTYDARLAAAAMAAGMKVAAPGHRDAAGAPPK